MVLGVIPGNSASADSEDCFAVPTGNSTEMSSLTLKTSSFPFSDWIGEDVRLKKKSYPDLNFVVIVI